MAQAPTRAAGLNTWCEVDVEALAANVRTFRNRLAQGALLGVVVKSNAYGHGLAGASRAFAAAGADWLVTNTVDEAVALRRARLNVPIYITGYVSPSQAHLVAEAQARVVVYDPDVLGALAAAGAAAGWEIPLHIKIETGNHRQGLEVPDALALAARAQALAEDTGGVRLEGLATHFADVEDTTDHRFARLQRDRFQEAGRAFEAAGFRGLMRHASNSAATILWPESHLSLARVGIASYGLWPSTETYATMLQAHATGAEVGQGGGRFVPALQPALTWRARVAQVKDVPRGGFVGYGRTYRATSPSRLAVIPVGYYEGYDRRLSNLAHVLIAGERAPVRGRVCMNMIMADVTHIPGVRAGDVATLLGADGDEAVTADQLAAWMHTINYEVVSRIHPDVPRIHLA